MGFQLLKDHHEQIKHIHLLVLPSEMETAMEELSRYPDGLFTLIPGDITKDNLGIEEGLTKELQKSVTHVFHLAALYDLAVSEKLAWQVNVEGTRNVTKWVQKLQQLKRYIYFSTAYVSGTREGKIYETELDMGQSFKNHYEETKFKAELIVEAAKSELPTTIIRPGIVRGNSKTGETIKFDGIYFMLNLFDRLSFLPIVPYLGDGHVEGNFVPEDYVLQATSFLSFQDVAVGKTYHLTDPHPYTMRELYTMLAHAYLGRKPKGQVSLSLAGLPMQSPAVEKWLKVEKEALEYFTIRSSYDCSLALKDLEGSGIRCPDFKETIGPMIDFYRKYKDDLTKHIIYKLENRTKQC